MKPKEAVEVEYGLARNVDGRPHRIVRRFGMRYHNVEPVRGATLEDHYQPLVLAEVPRGNVSGHDRTAQKRR